MYAQTAFQENRRPVLVRAMRKIQFAALVTTSAEGLQVSHLPVLMCEHEDGSLALEAHVARPNPIGVLAAGACEAMLIFQGPHAYVHPGWYPTKARTGRGVPTWNYIAVHAHGTLEAVEDEAWLRRHLGELTATREAGRTDPWTIDEAPADYIAGLLRGIIGVRLTVGRLEGAWKLSQNQPQENRLGVMQALAASSDTGEQAVAAAMQALNES